METQKEVESIHCDVCKEQMDEGFFVEAGLMTHYFCSEQCRRHKFTDRKYDKMYENNMAFWTTWYDL